MAIRKKSDDVRINDKIRARTVRLISAEGEQLGIVPIEDALNEAKAHPAVFCAGRIADGFSESSGGTGTAELGAVAAAASGNYRPSNPSQCIGSSAGPSGGRYRTCADGTV